MDLQKVNFIESNRRMRLGCLPPSSDAHQIFSLPLEVIMEILNFLDLKSLMNLRLVSHLTKSWIDQPLYLRKFVIFVNNKTDGEKIMESSIPWNNFYIDVCGFKGIRSIVPILTFYRPVMKIVKFRFGCRRIIARRDFLAGILLHLGTQLESLTITGYVFYPKANVDFLENSSERPETKFLQLRHIDFNANANVYIASTRAQLGEYLVRLFVFLLQNSPNLDSVKLPIGYSFLTFQNDSESLVDFLKQKILTNSTNSELLRTNASSMTIDFGSSWKSIRKVREFEHNSSIASSILIELTKLCEPMCGRFYNVPCSALPCSSQISNFTSHEKHCLTQCIGSIFHINDVTMEIKNRYIPSGAIINVLIRVGFCDQENYSTFQLPSTLTITSINLYDQLTTHLETGIDILYGRLFLVCRPSIIKLKLFIPAQDHSWFRHLGHYFLNLQSLKLRCSNYYEPFDLTEFIPLDEFAHLEHLSLNSCYIDFDILLKKNDVLYNHPFISTMKRLKHLSLENIPTSCYTDYTFLHLFRKIRLKTFICRQYKQDMVTFKKGLSTLTSAEGSIKDTIEIFECFTPMDSSFEDMKQLITHFKNLKRATFHCLKSTMNMIRKESNAVPGSNCWNSSVVRLV